MIKLRISIFKETWEQTHPSFFPSNHQVLWVKSGAIIVDGNTIHPDSGVYVNSESHIELATTTQIIRFEIAPDSSAISAPTNNNLLLSDCFTINNEDSILRLDRVTFPANAIAYRHTHPGAGIRYLLSGQLRVAADDHTQLMESGQAWFEDAYSPVKATAGPEGVTEFIRVMVLPPEFLGKPTIKRLNPEDMEKPTLQTNTRYFDLAPGFSISDQSYPTS
jgi:quercetin dioxygenase-like cupin family protein